MSSPCRKPCSSSANPAAARTALRALLIFAAGRSAAGGVPFVSGDIHGMKITVIDTADGKPLRVLVRSVAENSEVRRVYGMGYDRRVFDGILRIGSTRVTEMADDAAVVKSLSDAIAAHEPFVVESEYLGVIDVSTYRDKTGAGSALPPRAGRTDQSAAFYATEMRKAGIDTLYHDLQQVDADHRAPILKKFGQLGGKTSDAQRVLVAILSDRGDPAKELAGIATDALAETFGDSDEGIATLIALLRDSNDWVRVAAIGRLGRLGSSKFDKVFPGLIDALDDSDLVVQGAAMGWLVEYAAQAKAAVPALMRVLKDPEMNDMVRAGAFASLSHFGPEAAAEAMAAVVKDVKVLHQIRALDAMSSYGAAARAALPALKSIGKEDSEPESEVARSLVKQIEKSFPDKGEKK